MFERNHKPEWSSEELDILYKNYWKMNEYELAGLLPNRSLCAVKNKIKQLKYGKYHTHSKKRY
jgi:hypothetical protein